MTSRSLEVSGSSVIFGSGGTAVVSATGCGGAGVGGGGTVPDEGGADGGSGLATGGLFLWQAPAVTSRASTTAAYRFCVIALCLLLTETSSETCCCPRA